MIYFNTICFLIATTISLVAWNLGIEIEGNTSFFYLIAVASGACAIGYALQLMERAGYVV